MSGKVSRRRLITTGLGAVAGVGAWRATASVLDRYGLIPANCRGVYGLSETLTYAGQRLLTKLPSMAREFDRSQISTVIPVNGPAPKADAYQRLLAGGFADWRLTIDGLVDRPGSFSLADLKRFPSEARSRIRRARRAGRSSPSGPACRSRRCSNAWACVSEARFVFFFTFDDWWDSLDMDDVLHPQTLLAYAMNGPELPTDHGAPLRLKVPRQLGYKNLKYLSRITVTDTPKGIGDGLGSGAARAGYAWYAGI